MKSCMISSEIVYNKHMDYFSYDYVLAPFAYHQGLLALKKGRLDVPTQLITREHFVKDTIIDLDMNRFIALLMTEKNIPPQTARQYASELTFIPPEHDHPKIQFLAELYAFAVSHECLKPHPLSKQKYRNKSMLVLGEHPDDPQLLAAFESFGVHATWVQQPTIPKNLTVSTFDAVADEVSFVFNTMGSLLEQGVSLNNIVLFRPQAAYEYELKRQSRYYGFPIQWPSSESFSLLPIMDAFDQQRQQGVALHELDFHGFPEAHQNTLKGLIASCPQSLQDHAYVNEWIHMQTDAIRLPTPRYAKAIRVVKDGYFSKDDFVFVLGFSQGAYPHVIRDVTFLDDTTKHTCGLLTSRMMNERERHRMGIFASAPATISWSRSTLVDGQDMRPSPFETQWSMRAVQHGFAVNVKDYSQTYGRFRHVRYDELKKRYHVVHPYHESFAKAYPMNVPRYNNAFIPFKHPVNDPIRLSYSAINDYFKCGFKYFVSRILRVQEMDQDTFYLHLGSFAHEVFEHTDGKDASFSETFDAILERQVDLTAKERVLFANLKDKLHEVATFNALHAQHMNQPRMLQELGVTMHVDDHTVMKGFIDRTIVVSDAQGRDYIAVMDYKSGSESFDEKVTPYGWSLQLPIYALMLQYHPELKDKQLLGVFIQHIINKKMNEKRLTINGQSFPLTYQLDGIALNQPQALSWFDATVKDPKSSFIKGVKQTQSGMFAQSNRLKTEQQLKDLQLLAKQKIIEASKKIRARDYAINPIQVGGKSSCDHCPFIDVCFRHPKDVQRMTPERDDEAQDDELN